MIPTMKKMTEKIQCRDYFDIYRHELEVLKTKDNIYIIVQSNICQSKKMLFNFHNSLKCQHLSHYLFNNNMLTVIGVTMMHTCKKLLILSIQPSCIVQYS